MNANTEYKLSSIHTTKRGKNERGGVHAWHPYYAGYSETFVDEALAALANPGSLVLDPWDGSGTTTFVAQRRGLRALGVEINPVMAIHAQAKDLRLPLQSASILAAAREVVELAAAMPAGPEDGASEFAAPRTWAALRALVRAIGQASTIRFPTVSLNGVWKTPPSWLASPEAFLLSAAFQTLRSAGHFRKGSNPTWLRAEEVVPEVAAEVVFATFLSTAGKMMADLEAAGEGHGDFKDVHIAQGDVRGLALNAGVVDVVVTSPPYCTRIDYVVPTRPELELIGVREMQYKSLRRATMGAPVVLNNKKAFTKSWGALCNEFLDRVLEHNSKASASYYSPMFSQYFEDAWKSLIEIRRVLKPKGVAAVVVQSSYYKDVPLPLGEIYVQMAEGLDFRAEIGKREVVRQHMAHLNVASNAHAPGKVYHEDVILLYKD